MDYRYFPEPDLLPLELSDEFIAEARTKIPELPIEKRIRYLNEYKLSEDDARILTTDRELSEYFDELNSLT
jgi:aspartyl/glutamyl-tRNA(asn/gln) amidotransferase subunit B